jgi:hypothetical protein
MQLPYCLRWRGWCQTFAGGDPAPTGPASRPARG